MQDPAPPPGTSEPSVSTGLVLDLFHFVPMKSCPQNFCGPLKVPFVSRTASQMHSNFRRGFLVISSSHSPGRMDYIALASGLLKNDSIRIIFPCILWLQWHTKPLANENRIVFLTFHASNFVGVHRDFIMMHLRGRFATLCLCIFYTLCLCIFTVY